MKNRPLQGFFVLVFLGLQWWGTSALGAYSCRSCELLRGYGYYYRVYYNEEFHSNVPPDGQGLNGFRTAGICGAARADDSRCSAGVSLERENSMDIDATTDLAP